MGIVNPLVLVRTVASRQLVVFACEKARQAGIDPGMTLAEAGALCPDLIHQEHQSDKDLQGLHRLARWMVRFTPVVAVEPPDALFLDLTGSERLFHGMDQLVQLVHQSLTRLGLHFHLALAETPGAAWALAEGKRSTWMGKRSTFNFQRSTFNEEMPESSLPVERWTFAQLPIAALRLDTDQIQAFHNLGIQTIGQLMSLPRQTLPARFGQSVLHRLDQALGRIPEPLVPIPHSRPITAKIEFESGIDSLTDLWQAFKLLLKQITQELRQRSCGARQIIADFFLPGQGPISKTISLSRPTVNQSVLWNLLRCSTETVQSGPDGFIALKLSVPLFDRLTVEQLHLLDQQAQAAAGEMDHLIERLRVRLGENTVLFPQAVEAHLPEKAICLSGERSTFNAQLSTFNQDKCEHRTSKEMQEPSSPLLRRSTFDVRRSTFNLQPSTFDGSTFVFPPPPIEPPVPKPRPLHLLPVPIELQCSSLSGDLDQRKPISFTRAGEVHPLLHCNGPERITGSWWEGRNKTRDYFDVEDQSGKRFWIFRVEETRRWYLHGVFDS